MMARNCDSEGSSFSRVTEAGRLVIKVSFGDDIRCIPIHNEDITYDELVLMMQRVFRGKVNTGDDVLIKYKDEDGDLVTIFDSSDLTYAIHCSKTLKLTLLVNNQPKQLTNEELRYLRHQLQDVRNRVNHLLDNLDCCGPMNVSNTADSFTDGNCPATAGGIAHSVSTSVSNATSSFDPLTEQKYSKDGTTTGSADTGLQTPYNQEIQQDTQANFQVHGGYAPTVRPPYGTQHHPMMSGSYEQHHAAAGVHQPTSNPSPEHQMHSGQQMAAAHRPVYTAAVPSVVPQGQPLSASVATYSQPAGYVAQQHFGATLQQATPHGAGTSASSQPNPYSRPGPVYGQYPQPHSHYPPAL